MCAWVRVRERITTHKELIYFMRLTCLSSPGQILQHELYTLVTTWIQTLDILD